MKMRFLSGPVTGRPLIRTLPLLGGRKPATMLSKVDLPQPDGPTMQTNSDSLIDRFMFSRTGIVLEKHIQRSLIVITGLSCILSIETPTDFFDSLETAYEEVESQTD